MKRIVLPIVAAVAGVLFLTAGSAIANHSWGNYHWARTSNPFTLKVEDDVTSAWDSYLTGADADWDKSTVLDLNTADRLSTSRSCSAILGQVRVCNKKYGYNGWLGVAQIWVYSDSHIAQGIVKVNDSYFNTSTYNTPAWRAMVMCQEIGHTLGLGHQDENFNNADLVDASGKASCMDYSADPSQNQHPNQHDYDELVIIYGSHTDSYNSYDDSTSSSSSPPGNGRGNNLDDPSGWGRLVSGAAKGSGGSVAVYARDLGGGNKLFTFVIWAE